jgi:hypothetical protein
MKYNVWLDNNKFTYELGTERTSQLWASWMRDLTVDNLRPELDPWHGVAHLGDKINEINELIDAMNTWLPRVINGHVDPGNPVETLNALHAHFPEQESVETDDSRLAQLRRFNDLYHQIDLGLRSQGANIFLLVVPENPDMIKDLIGLDFEQFSPSWAFGDLLLHYPHAGRHPFEVFTSDDTDVPEEQIVCQTKISPAHTLRFFDCHETKDRFDEFYASSEITWPHAIDDPKLAVGYIKLGHLVEVNDAPVDRAAALELVKASSTITRWEIV